MIQNWQILRHHDNDFVDHLDYSSYASSGNLKGMTLINLPPESQVGYDSTQSHFRITFKDCTHAITLPYTPHFSFASAKDLRVEIQNCTQGFWNNSIELTTQHNQGTLYLIFNNSEPNPHFISKILSQWKGKHLIIEGLTNQQCQNQVTKWKDSIASPIQVMMNNMSLQ